MKRLLWVLSLWPWPVDVITRSRVETHELAAPFSAVIERRTFSGGSVGYVVLIVDHTLRKLGEGELADIEAGRVWTGDRVHWSVQGAREHIPDELERARAYWEKMDSVVSYTNEK